MDDREFLSRKYGFGFPVEAEDPTKAQEDTFNKKVRAGLLLDATYDKQPEGTEGCLEGCYLGLYFRRHAEGCANIAEQGESLVLGTNHSELDGLLNSLPDVPEDQRLPEDERQANTRHWSTWPHALQRESGRLEALSHLRTGPRRVRTYVKGTPAWIDGFRGVIE